MVIANLDIVNMYIYLLSAYIFMDFFLQLICGQYKGGQEIVCETGNHGNLCYIMAKQPVL